MSSGPERAIIALGANLGDREASLRAAASRVARIRMTRILAASSMYDTAPVGPPDQPRYLNAALLVETALDPVSLVGELLAAERALGRERDGSRWLARVIDLDLILHGDAVIAGSRSASGASDCAGGGHDVEVPHPRFRERAFVLVPIVEIAPAMRDPVTGERVDSLLRSCPGRDDVRVFEHSVPLHRPG
ncbi:MAG: 2-amino-4-hydroxy-6-hydroxymethyldihydropteridine diphosphokinase [Phycisphaerales bacterium]